MASQGSDKLFFDAPLVADDSPLRANKVTVVGVGQVGMACAYSLLTQQIVKNIVLADVMRDRLLGEVADLQHGGNFLPATITASSEDYHETAGSDICIITAGARQREGESRLELVGRNYEIFKGIIPKLVQYSPDTLFLVISNPCDVLSYVTYKLSGLPAHRVIGSGTYLDSSRFRVLLAKEFHLNPQSVHGWILGEHGDSSVPVWSTVNIAGVPITSMLQGKDENLLDHIHHQVVGAAAEVIKLKGYTNWAIGAAVAAIVRCIFHDEKRVLPLGTLVKGRYGIEEDVYLSVPVVLGRRGIMNTIHVPLKDDEQAKLKASAKTLHSVLSSLNFEK